MIYKVEDGFVISSRQVWLPGVYESERSAKYAFRFKNEILHRLQEIANREARAISFTDLQNAYQQAKE